MKDYFTILVYENIRPYTQDAHLKAFFMSSFTYGKNMYLYECRFYNATVPNDHQLFMNSGRVTISWQNKIVFNDMLLAGFYLIQGNTHIRKI